MRIRTTWLAMVYGLGCGSGDGGHEGESEAESEGEGDCVAEPLDLTGRFGVLATLNVEIDSSLGIPIPPSTSSILLLADFAQDGTSALITARMCDIEIPPIMLENAKKPILFVAHEDVVASIDPVSAPGELGTAETCTTLRGDPITAIAGAVLDSPDAALPDVCCDDPPLACGDTDGTNCACDQEGDGECGATVFAMNTPAVEIREVYAALRTSFALDGRVLSTDRIAGTVVTPEGGRLIEQSVIDCRDAGDQLCSDAGTLDVVRALSPSITQNPAEPSTFLGLRVDTTVDCPALIEMRGSLFR